MKMRSQSVRGDVLHRASLFFVLAIAVFFSFVEAVHGHERLAGAPGFSDTHCVYCVAARSTVATREVSFRPVLTIQPGHLLVAKPQAESRLVLFTSFIRPPPPAL